ncbi:hypothetical protein [Pseudanabaena sp. UWO310]|nr:hypothetical protein [Pseudanabaena sp. UWO310]
MSIPQELIGGASRRQSILDEFIPIHKMATPFCESQNLTGFVF